MKDIFLCPPKGMIIILVPRVYQSNCWRSLKSKWRIWSDLFPSVSLFLWKIALNLCTEDRKNVRISNFFLPKLSPLLVSLKYRSLFPSIESRGNIEKNCTAFEWTATVNIRIAFLQTCRKPQEGRHSSPPAPPHFTSEIEMRFNYNIYILAK